jgi:hypothetical protein
MADRCAVEKKLAEEVSAILARLVELTTTHLQGFREDRQPDVSRLDKELENTVGEKERALGALDQHRKEHGRFSGRSGPLPATRSTFLSKREDRPALGKLKLTADMLRPRIFKPRR